jgi:hypothetical protein
MVTMSIRANAPCLPANASTAPPAALGEAQPHPALIPAARITLTFLSVATAITLVKSLTEHTSGVLPNSAMRIRTSGSPRMLLISRFSRLMISAGVCLGATRPNHAVYSNPRHKFTQGRNGRQLAGALSTGHRQRAKPAGPHVGERRSRELEHNLYLSCKEIGDGWGAPAIRNVDHVYPGRQFKHLATDVLSGGHARGSEIDAPRVGFDVGNELRDRRRRERRIYDHDVGCGRYAGDRGDVSREDEFDIRVDQLVVGIVPRR